MSDYIARKSDFDDRCQTIINHLEGVATRAKENASAIGGSDLGYTCGIMHDIGKYSKKFQRRIKGEKIKVDHATAGGKWLYESEKKSAWSILAAYCCFGHHGGLPDGGQTNDSDSDPTLYGRLKKEVEDCAAWQTEILELPKIIPPSINFTSGFSVAFFTRMLFSALVDADCTDAAAFSNGAEQARGGFSTIAELNSEIEKHIKPFLEASSEVSPLNKLRTELLINCLSSAEKPSGLFTLTAPTGSGKTISSFAFALKHAAVHEKRRVIYVAPYNTIIEQNAKVFEDILGEENVLRHYGNHYYDGDENEDEVSQNKRFSVENWDYPIIATSSVQFFQSLFSNRNSVCRKLHNIANSVIILDEAQMIPVPFLIPCVKAIAELAANYGCTVLLATATQAKLEKYLGAMPYEIASNPENLHQNLRRNHINFLEQKLSDDELAQKLAENEQVLCIVNTRAHAQELFKKMKEFFDEGVYHLSTTLYPAHRERVLEEIRKRLKDGKTCRVVSTSMVEAGVDVDFPVVYRALAGLDSIVQAAGRCNREGKRDTIESNVYVFESEEHKPPASISPNISAAGQILRKFDDVASPNAMAAYFAQLFYDKGTEELDREKIVATLDAGAKNCFSFPFKKVSSSFRIIEDNTKTVYALHEAKDLEERLHNGERTKELFRKLANYAVSLYEHSDIKKLHEIGALKRVTDKFGNVDEILILADDYYDKDFGVHLSPEGGKATLL